MIRKLGIALIGALALISPAQAQTTNTWQCQSQQFQVPVGQSLVCSATWEFTSPGSTTSAPDLVTTWTLAGKFPMSGWNIQPWEPFPINMVGIHLTKASTSPHLWFMAGNSYVPDPMVFIPVGGGNSQTQWWPQVVFGPDETEGGTSTQFVAPGAVTMAFPPIGTAGDNHLDLHGFCPGTAGPNSFGACGPMQIWYTVYYLGEQLTFNGGGPCTNQQASAPGSGTTAGFNGNTWVDRSYTITNGIAVCKIGLYSASATAGDLHIVQRTAAGAYTVIASQSFSHPGGGWADFTVSVPIPASGEFHAAAYITSGTVNYAVGPRAEGGQSGDWSGSVSGVTEDTQAIFATRITY